MNGELNTYTTFWFNKTYKDTIHPTNSVFLTDGQDLKNRPILMLENIPKPEAELLSANYKELAYLLQDYTGYLISLIPEKKLKNGVSLIVDTTSLKKAEVEVVKEFVNKYKNPGNCMLFVYCICDLSNQSGFINQNTFSSIPAGVQVFLISSIAQLMIRIPSSQLHPIYGGTLKFNHTAWKQFMETFEALEAYITKYLNKSMMVREKADIILKRTQKEELRYMHPTLSYMNNVTVLQQCERIMNKFKNPNSYEGLKEVQNNPAFELARSKLEYYIAVLMNNHNYYVHNIKFIEDFLGIKSSPKKKKINKTNEKNPLSIEKSPQNEKRLLTLSNLLQLALEKKKENDSISEISFQDRISKSNAEIETSNERLDHDESEEIIKKRPNLLQHVININEINKSKNQTHPQTSNLSQHLSTLLLSPNKSEVKNEPIVMNVRNDDDEDEDIVKPKPKPRLRYKTRERETQTSEDDNRKSVILQTDDEINVKNINVKQSENPLKIEPISDSNNINSDLKKVQKWYLDALEIFDKNFINAINNASPDAIIKDIKQNECQDFLTDNELREKTLDNIMKNISDINDERTKQDVPILLYRVSCLKKVLNNIKHLKLIELKEIAMWKEQLQLTMSKNLSNIDENIMENSEDIMKYSESSVREKIKKNSNLENIFNNFKDPDSRQSEKVKELTLENDEIDINDEPHFEQMIQNIDHFLKNSANFGIENPENIKNENKRNDSNNLENLMASIYKDSKSQQDIKTYNDELKPNNFDLSGFYPNVKKINSIDSGINSPNKASEFSTERDPLDVTMGKSTPSKFDLMYDFSTEDKINYRISYVNRLLNEYDARKNGTNRPTDEELILKLPESYGSDNMDSPGFLFLPISPPTYDEVTTTSAPYFDWRSNTATDESGIWTVGSLESKIKHNKNNNYT